MAGGHAWQGGMHGRGSCLTGGVCGRRDGHCSGRHASYWNAFLSFMKLQNMSEIYCYFCIIYF